MGSPKSTICPKNLFAKDAMFLIFTDQHTGLGGLRADDV
jgi:hypothetical protein